MITRPRWALPTLALWFGLAALPSLALGGESGEWSGGCSACEAKYASPTRAREYYERAQSHWPGDPKEAWLWSRIALSFDHKFAEAQALADEVVRYCREADPSAPGCDFVLRGAAKAEANRPSD